MAQAYSNLGWVTAVTGKLEHCRCCTLHSPLLCQAIRRNDQEQSVFRHKVQGADVRVADDLHMGAPQATSECAILMLVQELCSPATTLAAALTPVKLKSPKALVIARPDSES